MNHLNDVWDTNVEQQWFEEGELLAQAVTDPSFDLSTLSPRMMEQYDDIVSLASETNLSNEARQLLENAGTSLEEMRAFVQSHPKMVRACAALTTITAAMMTNPALADNAFSRYTGPASPSNTISGPEMDLEPHYFAYAAAQHIPVTLAKLIIDAVIPDDFSIGDVDINSKIAEAIAVYATIVLTALVMVFGDAMMHGRNLENHPWAVALIAITQGITYATSFDEESIIKRHVWSWRGALDAAISYGSAGVQKLLF